MCMGFSTLWIVEGSIPPIIIAHKPGHNNNFLVSTSENRIIDKITFGLSYCTYFDKVRGGWKKSMLLVMKFLLTFKKIRGWISVCNMEEKQFWIWIVWFFFSMDGRAWEYLTSPNDFCWKKTFHSMELPPSTKT